MGSDPAVLERIRELNTEVELRPLVSADAPAYVALMNRHFTRKKSRACFDWAFSSPAIPTRLIGAFEQGRLLAFYGIQILRLNNDQACGFGIDLLIDAEERNRGLFVLLESEAVHYATENDAVAIAALSNQAGMRAQTAVKGWELVGTVHTLALTGSLDPHASVTVPAVGEWIGFEKDRDYRAWRFDQHPGYSYTRIDGPNDTHALTKIFTDPVDGARYGDIVDLCCEPLDCIAQFELLRDASQQLQEQAVCQVTTWALPHTPLRALAEALGFVEQSQERYFCLKVLQPAAKDLLDYERWHLVQADAEIY